jgi:hypothetical protein
VIGEHFVFDLDPFVKDLNVSAASLCLRILFVYVICICIWHSKYPI